MRLKCQWTDLVCAACGSAYSVRADRVGLIHFCSRICRISNSGTLARFAAKIIIGGMELHGERCWLWQGVKGRGGYGKFRDHGKTTLAHRYAYRKFIGEIPTGLELDHLCRTRECCNPRHLEAVTAQENLLRGNTVAARNVAKTHCPKGHEYTPANTYRYPDGRRRCIECRRISDMRPGPVARRRLHKIKKWKAS